MTNETSRQVAVVTGASAGIGKETAKALAALGWRVIGVGRNGERCVEAESEIRAVAQGGTVDMIRADLASMAEAAQAARAIAALTDRIDVLLNNAGGIAKERVITAEGYEANFAGNHLGPFLLTDRLLPLLRQAAAEAAPGRVRIINTASDASEMVAGMSWDNLQHFDDLPPGAVYCQGKLANVLHARGLAQRLAGDGIIAHAVHPGTVASNFPNYAEERTQAYMRSLDSMSPEQAAEALVWLATAEAPGRSTGGYFHQTKPMPPNPFVEDGNIDRLWRESERLIGLSGA